MINRFNNENFYLSNFYKAPIFYKGIQYSNNEAAFQAQKSTDEKVWILFSKMGPVEARNKGKELTLRNDWEEVKDTIMYDICLAKFEQNPDLLYKLMMTGNRPLEEGNTWDDKYWGTVNGEGQNKLGKILMKIRDDISKDYWTLDKGIDFINTHKKNKTTIEKKSLNIYEK